MLVTDVNIPHTLTGIPYKGFQAVGRLKVIPHKIYHITNNFGKQGMRGFETIQEKWLYNAAKQIDYYNTHVAACAKDEIEDNGLLLNVVNGFSKFESGVAEIFHMKLDQYICAEYCKEHYNSIETIEETWQSLNYETEFVQFDLSPVVRIKKSEAEINRQVIERFEEFSNYPERYVYEAASATIKKYEIEFQLLFDAYKILHKTEMEKLNYDTKAMKAALIEKSNQYAEAKLRLMLIDEFQLNGRYSNKYIKNKLRKLYDLVGIKNSDGSVKTAFAEQLRDFGLFELKDCKADDEHGKKKPGLQVIRLNYSVKLAA
jgi:hypothetical protein